MIVEECYITKTSVTLKAELCKQEFWAYNGFYTNIFIYMFWLHLIYISVVAVIVGS
jgi:hypothetical protein